MIGNQSQAQRVPRLVEQLAAQCKAIAIVEFGVEGFITGSQQVGCGAVAAIAATRDAVRPVFRNRAGQGALAQGAAVITKGDLGRAAKFSLGSTGANADNARRSIFTKQRRLRTAEYFDPFKGR